MTAKEQVLKVCPHAVWISNNDVGSGIWIPSFNGWQRLVWAKTARQAWANAAANLKRNLK